MKLLKRHICIYMYTRKEYISRGNTSALTYARILWHIPCTNPTEQCTGISRGTQAKLRQHQELVDTGPNVVDVSVTLPIVGIDRQNEVRVTCNLSSSEASMCDIP